MTPDVLDAVRRMLVQFEGNTPYMYLDSVGVVTVGIGCALFAQSDATYLGGGSPEDAWTAVKALPVGMRAAWYSLHCAWRGQPDALEDLFERRLAKAETDLLAQFPDLASWPVGAQVATFDLAWNCGAELVHHWPHLTASLRALDWQTAADQCAVHNGPAMRNDARRALFLSCLTAPPATA